MAFEENVFLMAFERDAKEAAMDKARHSFQHKQKSSGRAVRQGLEKQYEILEECFAVEQK